jgi:hypothetical protein
MVTDLERMYATGFAALLCAFFVWDAIRTGETFVTPIQTIRRTQAPRVFWLVVGTFAAMGLIMLGWTIYFAIRSA